MATRSSSLAVRNPLFGLPSFKHLQAMPPECKALMRQVLREVAADARVRAEKCWKSHKAPMAAYWKAVAVYAGHTARALKVQS